MIHALTAPAAVVWVAAFFSYKETVFEKLLGIASVSHSLSIEKSVIGRSYSEERRLDHRI